MDRELVLAYALDNKLTFTEAQNELVQIRDTDKQTFEAIQSDLWQRYAD